MKWKALLGRIIFWKLAADKEADELLDAGRYERSRAQGQPGGALRGTISVRSCNIAKESTRALEIRVALER